MKISIKFRRFFLLALVLSILMGNGVKAQEEMRFVEGTVWKTATETDVRERPDDQTDSVGKLEAGEIVFVTEDETDGFCKIQTQLLEGYVSVSVLQMVNAENVEQIGQEFETVEQFDNEVMDEYTYLQSEKRTTLMWGSVIGILVLAIFGVGVISAVRNGRTDKKK